jgi:hypothetical protein
MNKYFEMRELYIYVKMQLVVANINTKLTPGKALHGQEQSSIPLLIVSIHFNNRW